MVKTNGETSDAGGFGNEKKAQHFENINQQKIEVPTVGTSEKQEITLLASHVREMSTLLMESGKEIRRLEKELSKLESENASLRYERDQMVHEKARMLHEVQQLTKKVQELEQKLHK